MGSAVTSAAAFVSLLLHPHPQLESFGVLVVLAVLASFLVSVFVLPSLLAIWWRRVGADRSVAAGSVGASTVATPDPGSDD